MAKHKLMLVDDDKHVLDSLSRILKNPDYDIHICESAMDAWSYINAEKGNVDIIISDNKMPDSDGTELLVAIRKKYPNIVRIMLTGHSSLDDAKKAINEGRVYKFLTKPCDPDDLRLVVKHALAQKDLWLENKELWEELQEQKETLAQLEKAHPGIASVEKDEAGSIVIRDDRYTTLDDFMKKYFKESTTGT